MTVHTTVKVVLCCVLTLSATGRITAQTLETESARVLPAHAWEVGYAFEAQTSSEGTERAMPFAFEYGLSDRVELLIEQLGAVEHQAVVGAGRTDVSLAERHGGSLEVAVHLGPQHPREMMGVLSVE